MLAILWDIWDIACAAILLACATILFLVSGL